MDGASVVLVLTQQGLDALEPAPIAGPAPEPTDGPVGPLSGDTVANADRTRPNLRSASTALLAERHASSAQDATDNPINRAVEALRVAAQARLPRPACGPRTPRQGTKQETVPALLRRPEGATIAQIAEATGWAQHTVRGFFAGLKKKGHAVEVKSRERMVGPNKTGAKGSFTIYGIAG